MVISDPRDLARHIAAIILESAYRKSYGNGFYGVHDVLLFGSAVRGEPAEDIDMLIVHNTKELQEFSLDPYTLYLDGIKPKEAVTHADQPVSAKNNTREIPGIILKDMGCPVLKNRKNPDAPELVELIYLDGFWELVPESLQDVLPPFVLDEDGRNNLARYDQFRDAYGLWYEQHGTEDVLFKDAVYKQFFEIHVDTQVKALLDSQGLEISSTLDLHVMHFNALSRSGKRWRKKRQELIHKKCRDPTFWYTVLSEGRLYDPTVGDFVTEIGDKYPRALEYFTI
jgi:hypothetical protein